nr:MAG TPA: hypothetical protein [Caudoviricetes sp.]
MYVKMYINAGKKIPFVKDQLPIRIKSQVD